MPKIIYYSKAITWYLQNTRVHVSRVHKRVSKSVNFKVQKVQKPDLFYLMNNFPRSPALMTIFYHQQNPSAIHFIYLFTLAPCEAGCIFVLVTNITNHAQQYYIVHALSNNLCVQPQPGCSCHWMNVINREHVIVLQVGLSRISDFSSWHTNSTCLSSVNKALP